VSVLPVLALLATLACAGANDDTPRSDGPLNIVLAIADDLDPDHLGFCGSSLARTPHLDELARAGVTFPTLYAQPVCRAALATLLTGRWPHETGMTDNQVRTPLAPAGALPGLLKARGYATYCAGKFWEGDLPGFGFDAPPENDERFARDGGQDELFRFLEEHAAAGPWFVWWAPSLPHTPHRPPVRFAKDFEEVAIEVPAGFQGDPDEYVKAERASLAMHAWLDAELGRLVAKLRELGELDQTLILFLADNGWSTSRWAKGTPMEKGVRSPLVVRLPGAEGAGRKLDALVDLVDVHATVLDYSGSAVPPGSHGRSLRPLLEGRAFEPRARLFGAAYTRFGNGPPAQSAYALYARDARWKYVFHLREVSGRELSPGAKLAPPFRARGGQQRLFDLAQDPREEHNLAASPDHAERVRDLHAAVLDWWRASGGAELELPGSAR
jgi:uncharacterized sulfatase